MTLLDPIRLRLLHNDESIDRATLDRILTDLQPGLARLPWQLVRNFLLGVVVTGLAFTLFWLLGGPNFRAAFTRTLMGEPWIWIPLIIGVFIITPLIISRQHRRRVPELLLRHQRCPHCGYDLRGLPRDDADGLTVCPECASAWDLGDTGM